eukprot:g29986.t1
MRRAVPQRAVAAGIERTRVPQQERRPRHGVDQRRFVATPLAEQEEDPLNVWAKEELQQRASNVQFLQSRWYFDAPWRPLGFDAGSLQELRHVAAVRSIVALANTSGAEEMTSPYCFE